MKIIKAVRCWLLEMHIISMQSDVSVIVHQQLIDYFNKSKLERRIVDAQRRLDGLRRSS